MTRTVRSGFAIWIGWCVGVLNPTAFGMQDPYRTLEELVEETPVIVVGHIERSRSKTPADIGGARFEWDADLRITRVLKGSVERQSVRLFWLERWIADTPPYTVGQDGIWFLWPAKRENSYEAGRADALMPLDRLGDVEALLPSGPVAPSSEATH